MDDNPDPAREGNLSIETTQSLESSASLELMKPTEAMSTGDGATVHLGPVNPDQEHTEATKGESSALQSASKLHKASSRPKVAHVHFLNPAELERLKVASNDVSVPTRSNQVLITLVSQIKYYANSNLKTREPYKNISEVLAEAGALPEATGRSAAAKQPERNTNISDVNDDADLEKVSKVGFKHDPDEERALANVELDVGRSNKKKNKRRPKSQRGENAPTGFEPFYADAPITPAEFEENKTIYDPALPILDRIDEGIKRFLYKRRLEPYRRKVFLKYLQYGGVSVGPNHSQGVTPSELKEMTKEEAMQARCTTAIFPKRGKPYPIDFNAVATGYLTGYYMGYYNPDTEEEIKVCTDTMKNFFSYLLYHDVCPEQTEDLQEARRTCDRSAKELWMNQQLVHHSGPGDFNRGCSMLFGGYYFEDVDDPDAWTNVRHADQKAFTSDIARKVVKYAIAIAGNDRTARKFKILADMDLIEAKQVEDIDGFEVISVEAPTEETIAYYKELGPDLIPVGKVRAKEFRDPARGPFDLAPWEKVDWDAGFAPAFEFEFLLEADFFVNLLPGMKIITTVYETNFGQYYFDEILSVLPTFYKFLYNDWMMDYVEPMPINFIPDEEEVARRRAKDSIIEPPEPTPAEWAMHILTHELNHHVTPDDHPMRAIWEVVHALQCFGWDMEEIKWLMNMPKDPYPERGRRHMAQGEPRPVRLSNEDRGVPFDETPFQRLNRIIGYYKNPERTKPVFDPEIMAKALSGRKKQVEKQIIQAGQAAKALQEHKKDIEKEQEKVAAHIAKLRKEQKEQMEMQIKQAAEDAKEQAQLAAQIAKEQGPEVQPCQGPTDSLATQTLKEAIDKNKEIKGELEGEDQ
ncbi:Argonaute complex subunit Arb1 [Penicillium concentricum]|uniref:Argonaute complex subunit Arb1 n=1 Tax=Penicillium concentricum TaxID=293559 RepID=A0A9W9UVJ2_9EURO|nr:Argonaute complex subunit Arb1 [Penicillium concentricum]KAJ5356321.1 Argonaute complex subunit Arb1 [Penicillium concentricum]